MNAALAPVRLQRTLSPEDAARGNFYALLARLCHAGPDQSLLASLAGAEALAADADPALAKAWLELTQASSVMDSDAGATEHDNLFAGLGKAPVSIYAGFYTGAMAIDHPRVRLQAEFAALGVERRVLTEPEDHFATIFDVMRVLVAGGAGRASAALAEQRRFFDAFVKTGAPKFFNALIASDKANYYRKVAALGLAFIAIETESFSLD